MTEIDQLHEAARQWLSAAQNWGGGHAWDKKLAQISGLYVWCKGMSSPHTPSQW